MWTTPGHNPTYLYYDVIQHDNEGDALNRVTTHGETGYRPRVMLMAAKNTTIREIRAIVDEICEQYQEETEKQYLIIPISSIVARYDLGERSIRENGYPAWFANRYDSCTWKKYKGLHIIIDDYLEERRDEEHNQKVADIRETTHDLSMLDEV